MKDYFDKGRQFSLQQQNYHSVSRKEMAEFCQERCKHSKSKVIVEKISFSNEFNIRVQNDDVVIEAGFYSEIFFYNPFSESIKVTFALQNQFGYKLPKLKLISNSNGAGFIKKTNQWEELIIPANSHIILSMIDLDPNAKVIYRFKKLMFI